MECRGGTKVEREREKKESPLRLQVKAVREKMKEIEEKKRKNIEQTRKGRS